MPIHLEEVDVVSQAAGLGSALLVPCNMCPAVTVAVDQRRPFMQLLKSVVKSPPWKQHLEALQSRLKAKGVTTDVFQSNFYHQWFVCMWTSGRRKKLEKAAKKYDAVISMGCDTAHETVRDAVATSGAKVIEGMEVTGLMNARMNLNVKGHISFKDCKVIPISQQEKTRQTPA